MSNETEKHAEPGREPVVTIDTIFGSLEGRLTELSGRVENGLREARDAITELRNWGLAAVVGLATLSVLASLWALGETRKELTTLQQRTAEISQLAYQVKSDVQRLQDRLEASDDRDARVAQQIEDIARAVQALPAQGGPNNKKRPR